MAIYELKCFGIQPGQGNSALVLHGADIPVGAAARQAFASAAQRSACVFIDAGSAGAAWTLDYFYPHARSPLCLHATMAAARVLLADGAGPLPVRTALRGQVLELTQRAGAFFVGLTRQPTPATPPGLAELATRLLGAPGLALTSAPALASVGSPKLLVQVADSAILHALQPDLAAIAAWGQAHGISGIYAWCRRPDGALEGRNFNHLDAAIEDSATGVAAGALTVHLGHALELYQGAHLGQPCLLRTQLDGAHVLVGGAANFS